MLETKRKRRTKTIMKYLRTKDALYAYASNLRISFAGKRKEKYYRQVPSNGRLYRLGVGLLKNNLIIAMSDDIEELIDDWVVKCKGKKPKIVSKEELEAYLKIGATGYGAIWVDGGLRYVVDAEAKTI